MEEMLEYVIRNLSILRERYPGGLVEVLSRIGESYYFDPWDARRDDLAGGYEDDLLVALHIFLGIVHGNPEVQKAENARISDFDSANLENYHKTYIKLGEKYPELKKLADRYLAFSKENADDPDDYVERTYNSLLKVGKRLLNSLRTNFGGYLEWLVRSPALPLDKKTPCIGLFGPTSAGKTTLARRIVTAISCPRYSQYLPTHAGSHTTRIPAVIDFATGISGGKWMVMTNRERTGGTLPEKNSNGFISDLKAKVVAPDEEPFSGYFRLILPTSLGYSLRLIDLPGTHGYDPGPWAMRAKVISSGLDAVIVPGDRRYCKPETIEIVDGCLRSFPRKRVCMTLRYVHESASPASLKWYKHDRLGHNLQLKHKTRDMAFRKRYLRSLKAMPIFSFSKEEEVHDEMSGLMEWIAHIRPKRDRPPDYHTLEKIQNIHRGKEVKVKQLLACIGIMRALESCN